jgi:hypothetical protein
MERDAIPAALSLSKGDQREPPFDKLRAAAFERRTEFQESL